MEQLGHLSDGAEVQGGVRPIVVAGDFDCILYGSENGDVAVHVFVQLVGKSHQFVEILAVLSFLDRVGGRKWRQWQGCCLVL